MDWRHQTRHSILRRWNCRQTNPVPKRIQSWLCERRSFFFIWVYLSSFFTSPFYLSHLICFSITWKRLKENEIFAYGIIDGFNGTWTVDFVEQCLMSNICFDHLYNLQCMSRNSLFVAYKYSFSSIYIYEFKQWAMNKSIWYWKMSSPKPKMSYRIISRSF